MGKRKKKPSSVTYVYDPNNVEAAPEGTALDHTQPTTGGGGGEVPEDNVHEGGHTQLSKNKRRKLQKKKREKVLKEQAKLNKTDNVEFTYDPTASVPLLVPKGHVKEEEEEEEVTSPPAIQLKHEEIPSSPSPSPEPEKPPEPVNKYKDLVLKFRNATEQSREQEVKDFFKTILDIMKKEAITYFGDEDVNKYHQTELSCGKLFQMLDKKDVSKEILRNLSTIKRKLVMQEYDEAQGVYFSLTIGNAPWPTMLGSKNILEDEEKRKTLQAIKRLMTFFQQRMAPKPIPDE